MLKLTLVILLTICHEGCLTTLREDISVTPVAGSLVDQADPADHTDGFQGDSHFTHDNKSTDHVGGKTSAHPAHDDRHSPVTPQIGRSVDHAGPAGHAQDDSHPAHDKPSAHVGGNSSAHLAHDEGHEMDRFPVFHMDFRRIQTPLIIGLWLFCACLGKIAFHMTPKLSSMFPESCMLIFMGLLIGAIFVYANPNPESQVSPLTADIFFLYLLPPIILDAGYFMPNRLFFDHLGTILTFAVIGTIWNAASIGISLYALALTGIFGPVDNFPGLHIFLFSSLISAVDPVAVLAVFEEIQVEEVLFILVFGESLLNDGVTVVLYHMFEGFSMLTGDVLAIDIFNGLVSFLLVALGGTAIGIIWGFLAAFVTRFTYQVRVIEPIFVYIMSYLAYLNAELFHWSGILAITFCGITMKNYTERNISQKSQTTIKYSMKMLASSSETVIFLFLGVATVHGTKHDFNLWFVVFTILFCSVYRVVGVLILSAVCNRFRVQKIDFVQKFVMCYGGLRGAVAFALAITIDDHHIPLAPMFVTTCIAVVFFTVFVQGMTIKPVVDKLGVKKANKRDLSMNERLHERTMDYVMSGVEEIVGKLSTHGVRSWFKRLHQEYLVPALVHKNNEKEPKLFETLSRLRMQDAMNYMSKGAEPKLEMDSFAQTLQATLYNSPTTKEWNLDIDALDYIPGDKDINEARFHHLLSDEYHPVKKRRQSTYKRHAVKDTDLETNTDFRKKMFLTARQVAMTSIRRRNVKIKDDSNRLSEITRPTTQKGSSIRLRDDYLEETVRSRENPAFIDDEGLFLTKMPDEYAPSEEILTKKRMSTKGPSAAETFLPWKRFLQPELESEKSKLHAQMKGQKTAHSLLDGDGNNFSIAESILPWKRTDSVADCEPLKQVEFPAWAGSEEYVVAYSPSSTIIGTKDEDTERPSVRAIFKKQQSEASFYGSRSSLIEDMSSLRSAAKDASYTRRMSYKDDPTLKKRNSSKSLFGDRRKSEVIEENSLSVHPQKQVSFERRGSRDADSLLNTVIEEEGDRKLSNNTRIRDHIVNMDPDGSVQYDNTRF